MQCVTLNPLKPLRSQDSPQELRAFTRERVWGYDR